MTCATRELKKGGIYCNCTLATFGRLYHSVSETRGNHFGGIRTTFLLTQETRCVGIVYASSFPVRQWERGRGRGGEWKEISCSRHLRGVSVKTEVSKGDSRRPSHLVSRAASKLLLQGEPPGNISGSNH